MRNPTTAAANETDLPDPNYVDDGLPVEITLDKTNSDLWEEEDTIAGDAYRSKMFNACGRISAIAGYDVLLCSYDGRVLYRHKLAGETSNGASHE